MEEIQNEVLEKKSKSNENKPKMGKKRIFTIVAISVVFVGLLVLAIVGFKSPKRVSFSAPGLTGFKLDSELIKEDGTINAPDASLLEREHYDFYGWFDNKDGSGTPLDLSTHVFEKSMTLFAIWEPHPYEITYDYDGGTLPEDVTNPEFYTVIHEPTAREIEANKNAQTGGLTPTELESLMMRNGITINEPIKEGYRFAGWIITYNDQTETGDSATRFLKNVRREPVGAITLKATWA